MEEAVRTAEIEGQKLNRDAVRGYPEGDYLADTAGCVNFDWFFPLRRQIEPVIFVDLGGGKLKRTLSGERDDKFLAGVGAGIRLNFKLKIVLTFVLAYGKFISST